MIPSLLLFAGAPASAHPFGGTLPGHALRLTLSEQALELHYSARVPTHDVMVELESAGAIAPEAFTARKLDELMQNLRLEADGQRLAWARVEAGAGEGNSRAITYEQTLRAELPDGARELRISNGNYPDQTSYFFAELRVVPPLRLAGSSLVDIGEGRVLRTRDGQWRMDEAQRELTLALQPGGGPLRELEAWIRPPAAEPVPLAAALDLGPVHALRSGRLPAEALLVGLAGASLAGLGLPRSGRVALAPLVLAIALAAVDAPRLGLLLGGLGALAALPGAGLPPRLSAATAWIGASLLVIFAMMAGLVALQD